MDFIEKFLGISPDRGDHSFEVLLLVAVVTLIAAIGLRLSSIGETKDDARKKTRNRYFRGLWPKADMDQPQKENFSDCDAALPDKAQKLETTQIIFDFIFLAVLLARFLSMPDRQTNQLTSTLSWHPLCDTAVDLDLRIKPRDPEASIHVVLRDVQCPRCNGHGPSTHHGTGAASVDLRPKPLTQWRGPPS
jgi:hypothetical protein